MKEKKIIIKSLLINNDFTLLESLKKMDKIRKKLLIISENDTFLGLISIGDIQRAILNNKSLQDKVSTINRNEYIVAKEGTSFSEIQQKMIQIRAEFMPVVNSDNKLIDVIFWDEVFGEKKIGSKKRFTLPVVVMAGGLGTRLKPLTNILPKPLVPFKDSTIIEEIFSQFSKHGCNDFYLSLNYKAELIEYYLNQQNLSYRLEYIKEEKPLGTAGSLTLLKDKVKSTFFVTNCDILIDQDYSEILDYHIENHNEITIVAALKHYTIPYGTLESGMNGKLLKIQEKPEITFKINSGMYILEPHLLNEIPENKFFHITHLIENIMSRGGKAGVFPVSEMSWKDIGDWELFKKENNI